MREWQSTTLGQVVTISSGSPPPKLPGKFTVIGANGPIGSASIANFGPGYLVGRVGAVGVVTRVANECWASDNTLTILPRSKVDQSFLGLMLEFLDLGQLATKTAQPLITQTQLRSQLVSLPPPDEQRRIAEILGTVDESIQATERLITKHELVMEAILATAALGYPGTEDRTLGIGDFCRLSAGRTAPRRVAEYYGGGVPWVKSGELAGPAIRSTEETVTTTAVHDCGLRIIRSGTPLIAMYGATAGEVGWLDIDATTNQAVLSVEPDPLRANRRWLYWALRVNSARIVSSVQGSGQSNISKQIIGGARLSLPDLEEQLAEVARIDSAQALIEAHRAEATKLQLLRVGLASDLLSGRVKTVTA